MKVPQHPHVAKAQAALERGDSDAAWHLLRCVPKDFLEVPDAPVPPEPVAQTLSKPLPEQIYEDAFEQGVHEGNSRAMSSCRDAYFNAPPGPCDVIRSL